ncbi:MAG TPA: hypothetical protein VGR84_06700 [Candidatus Acidoferrales bacterium]|nr:hypothetical protein [Candidatus Acidoferrales bacterium]
MTVVAGFKNPECIVIAADTQETIGEHLKVSVPKIRAYSAGNWKMVVGGAGNANFIDLFCEKVSEIPDTTAGVKEIRAKIEEILTDIFRKHIDRVSGVREYLEFELVLGIWTIEGLSLIETADTATIVASHDFSCIGWGASHARKLADQLSDPNLPFTEKALIQLGIYILRQTKAYEPHCGGDTHVHVINKNGRIYRLSDEEFRDNELIATLFDKICHWPYFKIADEDLTEKQLDSFFKYYNGLLKGINDARKSQKKHTEIIFEEVTHWLTHMTDDDSEAKK